MQTVSHRPSIWIVGGVDAHLRIPLIKVLRDRDFNVCAVGSCDDALFAGSNILYYRYKLNRWVNPIADLHSVWQLEQLMRFHRPDLVHGFDTKSGIITGVAARRAGIMKSVRTVNGMGYVFSSSSLIALALQPLYRATQRLASRLSDVITFQNAEDRAYFLAHSMVERGKDELVRGSGLEVDRFLAYRPNHKRLQALRQELGVQGHKVVTMVSRLIRHKGVMEYFSAAQLLAKKFCNTTFLLVGPRSSEGWQAVSKGKIVASEPYVKYIGSRSDILDILSITDVFALPTYYREGIPRVLLEASAMGVACVTTDMPGCREAVSHGWNGFLIPPRNVEELADAISRLLRDNNVRRVMGERGPSYVKKHFDIVIVADAYTAIYNRLLNMA